MQSVARVLVRSWKTAGRRAISFEQHNLFDPKGDPVELTQITSYRPGGFNVNEIRLTGSIIAFSTFTLLWDAKTLADVNEHSLAILPFVKPKISKWNCRVYSTNLGRLSSDWYGAHSSVFATCFARMASFI